MGMHKSMCSKCTYTLWHYKEKDSCWDPSKDRTTKERGTRRRNPSRM